MCGFFFIIYKTTLQVKKRKIIIIIVNIEINNSTRRIKHDCGYKNLIYNDKFYITGRCSLHVELANSAQPPSVPLHTE